MKVQCALLAAVVASLAFAGSASAVVYTDNFDSYLSGSTLNGQGGWTDTGTSTYKVVSGGAGGTQGVNNGAGSQQMNWTGHLWNWGTDVNVGDKVVVRMDFQANGSGSFDDDRVGWVVAGNAASSSYHFGVQLDNAAATTGFETYFKDNSGTRVNETTLITPATLGATGSEWYREELTVTKLTSALGSAGAKVDVSFQALDVSGNLVGSPLTASYGNIDTSVLRGFSGDVYPMFKNYSAQPGNADNAYFAIVSGDVPEPATLSLLALVGLPLLTRRRRA
jgi:hypothetical protein